MNKKEIKEALGSVQMPETSKEKIKERIHQETSKETVQQIQKNHPWRKFTVIAAASVLLVGTLAGTVLLSMRHMGKTAEATDYGISTDGTSTNRISFSDESAEPEKVISASEDLVYSAEELPDSDLHEEGIEEVPDEVADSDSSQMKAGMLTAVQLKDNDTFEDFQRMVAEYQGDTWQVFPRKRICVSVPEVNNAKVSLLTETGEVIARAVTNLKGTAYLYYNSFNLQQNDKPYCILAECNGISNTVVLDGSNSTEVTVNLDTATSVNKLDVLVMLDTTGSMGDELTYLQYELEDVINRVKKASSNLSLRLSMNFYRDQGDDYVVDSHPFTSDISECQAQLNNQRSDGGGDNPEAVDTALNNAICDHEWDEDATKVMFIILDAPPHSEQERSGVTENLKKAIESACEKGIRVIPVVASGADGETEYIMRSIAAMTGGSCLFLTDDSGIGESHIEPDTTETLEVKNLNDLMVEVILSYIQK